MRNYFSLKSEFTKNVLTLLSGTSLAQLIMVLISPVLTRIYTPDDFGVLALFTAICTIIGMSSSGRYELAIVLPKKKSDVINLTFLAIFISLIVSIFLLIIIVFFHSQIIILLNNDALSPYLYLIPFVVFLIGIFNSLNYFQIKFKEFKNIAFSKLFRQICGSLLQVIWGLTKGGAFGLIGGRVLLLIVGNASLLLKIVPGRNLLLSLNFNTMRLLAKRYVKFPKFSLAAQLANTSSQHLNSLFISSIFSSSILGFYSLVNRVLNMPLGLITSSFSQVYLQKATEERIKCGNAKKTYKKTFQLLLIISLSIFGPLYFSVEDIFTIVFGKNWLIAGTYAKILLPLFFVRFIASPLSMTNIVFEKQKTGMFWQLLLLILTVLAFLITYLYNLTVEQFLNLFCLILSIHYGFLILITYKYSLGQKY